ncbi:hypothetical protein LEP1GSC151_0333 [Leptospira interrogans serovar Grippotyphosa str. LT2186]|uniref:Uncharacterized protein n=1 Tax=Leptospira interrogans serovar Grippotyphosa str. LT2186 TaxID=1001599 RepID=M3GYM7_LEPIR|nr:hypothetical protein LEP1GSC009_3598 [Leptospira interrogans serovar Grippotyphosa str. Andaman]EKP87335.1 hypothetical protein LEP1GSC020_2029 [Leptospira interrogans serovar Grippotyphosa str. 2006006986]EMG11848.1 hypothetical protein LEP1GSC151_0333 [Leptospira interrogans serovar Grippotyphosa str. LT2186]EMN84870.1 hypothetical protein LEP1GSC107_0002 [Leptospira interrogans serovar Grippotyphosa str. UI 12769]
MIFLWIFQNSNLQSSTFPRACFQKLRDIFTEFSLFYFPAALSYKVRTTY